MYFMFNKKITEKKVDHPMRDFLDLRNKDDYAFYLFLNDTMVKVWNEISEKY